MKSNKMGVALILLVPIGLVAGPILWAGTRSELALWYLAAAANAIELGKGDADEAIASALAWDPEVGRLQDYWSVRLRQLKNKPNLTLMDVLKQVPKERKQEVAERLGRQFGSKGDFALAGDIMQFLLGEKANQNIVYWDITIAKALEEEGGTKAVEILREALAANPANADLRAILAQQYSLILPERDEFDPTLEAYKIWFGEKYIRDTSTLNALAYGRALAHVELDQALVDIDEALSYHPHDPDLRDTRGWVLYHLGRFEEALKDAEFSVKAKESPSLTNWWQSLASWLQSPGSLAKEPGSLAKEPGSLAKEPGSLPGGPAVLPEGPGALPGGTSPSQNALQAQDAVSPKGATSDMHQESPVMMLDPPEVYLTRRNAGIALWSRGVLRYHRAKILEKLGRIDEANDDWKWLDEHHLPPDDRLH